MRIQTFNVPQADNIESIVQLIINVAHGARTDIELIQHIPDLGAPRQGRYYRKAAEIMGFLVNNNNNASLTQKGSAFILNPTITNPLFISSVLSMEVIQRLLPYMELHSEGLTNLQIANYISSIVSREIAQSTLNRRVITLVSWLRSLHVIELRGNRNHIINQFTHNLPVLELTDIEQPILPNSGNLTEYQIVQERIRQAHEDVIMYRDEAKFERARNAHIRLVNLVAQRITIAGGIPKSNQLIDLAVNIDQDYIFEMKSTNLTNTRSQVRKGVSQLLEYRYLENRPEANLILVIEKPLGAACNWMIDFVENNQKISLIWDGSNELYGTEATKEKFPFLNLQ